MVGQRTLTPFIKVRILIPQPNFNPYELAILAHEFRISHDRL